MPHGRTFARLFTFPIPILGGCTKGSVFIKELHIISVIIKNMYVRFLFELCEKQRRGEDARSFVYLLYCDVEEVDKRAIVSRSLWQSFD